MAQKYWIFEEAERQLWIPESRVFRKDPECIGGLLHCLRLSRRNKVLLSPRVFQDGNRFEFVLLYENGKDRAVERYASVSICESPVGDKLEAIHLAKGLEDCASDEEAKLWLRIAAPVADSALLLRREFRQPCRITNAYIERKEMGILKKAHEKRVLYHVYSKYCDEEQVMTDLALMHAF